MRPPCYIVPSKFMPRNAFEVENQLTPRARRSTFLRGLWRFRPDSHNSSELNKQAAEAQLKTFLFKSRIPITWD